MKQFISSIQRNGKVFALAGFGQAFMLVVVCVLIKVLGVEFPAGNQIFYVACAIIGFLSCIIGFIGLSGIAKNNK